MQNMKVIPEHGAETGSLPSEQKIKTIRWQRQLSAPCLSKITAWCLRSELPNLCQIHTLNEAEIFSAQKTSVLVSVIAMPVSLSLFLSSQHWYVPGCCKLCWLVDVNSCWVRDYSRYSVSLDTSRHPITSFKPCKPHPFLLHGPTYLLYFITLSEQSYSKLTDLLNYSVKSLLFWILHHLSQHSLLRRCLQTTVIVWIT